MADRPADSLFAEAIRGSRVDVADPQVENSIEQIGDGPLVRRRVRLCVFGLLVPSDLEGAEADRRHREPGISERPRFHEPEYGSLCGAAGARRLFESIPLA